MHEDILHGMMHWLIVTPEEDTFQLYTLQAYTIALQTKEQEEAFLLSSFSQVPGNVLFV